MDINKLRNKHKQEIDDFQGRCKHKKITTIKNEVGIPYCDECLRCGKIVKTITQYAMEVVVG